MDGPKSPRSGFRRWRGVRAKRAPLVQRDRNGLVPRPAALEGLARTVLVPLTRHESLAPRISIGVRFALTPRYLLKPLRGWCGTDTLVCAVLGRIEMQSRRLPA